MDRWIRDLINSVASGLTALINAVIERITWVYNVFIAVFIKVRKAFDATVKSIQSKLVALTGLARETYTTVRWIVFTRIPQIVGNAVTVATNYLTQQLNNARLFLKGLIDGLNSWVQQQVRRIDTFIADTIRWITTKINNTIDTLTRVRDIVFALLTDPRRLAAWVMDALVGEFLRWVDRNADRIFTALRERSIHHTMRAADKIENLLMRLL